MSWSSEWLGCVATSDDDTADVLARIELFSAFFDTVIFSAIDASLFWSVLVLAILAGELELFDGARLFIINFGDRDTPKVTDCIAELSCCARSGVMPTAPIPTMATMIARFFNVSSLVR
jgi:hypothetical protein